MRVLRKESSIERAVVERAFRKLGVPSIKLNGPGRRGNPDRLFLLGYGRVMFIEFKRPGGKVTPLQGHIQQQLKDLGFTVEVHDDVDRAIESIAHEMQKDFYHG